ncbi:MAG: hypothetical protein PHG81_06290 [Aliarcobacter sp.]|nr:hypothetical protein [Aliarcobacter sp.]
MNTHQVRRLPKRTVVIISIIIAIAFIIFYVIKDLKEKKITEVLATVGHANITQLKVINKLNVEDKDTRYQSTVYKVIFYDNDLNQSCIGFIHQERNEQYTKDLNCE